jgi:hypothetical protein
MKQFFIAVMLVMAGTQVASANCTRPVGLYVGSGGGVDYTKTGAVSNAGTVQLSINIPSFGPWSVKTWALFFQGKGASEFTVPAIGNTGNSFNRTICRGQFRSSTGGAFSYVVSDSGNQIELMPYRDTDSTVSAWIITLRKA